MSLADLVEDVAVIKSGKGSFEVRGLTLEDLASLLKNHMEEVAGLFEGKLEPEALLTKFPAFAASMIAYAAGEQKEVEKVKKLPFGVQLKAISEIWRLTSVDVDEVGKMFRSLVDGMGELSAQVQVSKTGAKS